MSTNAEWTLRSDLELFGINLPERFDFEEFAASLRDKPAQNTALFAAAAAIIFFYAERGQNPKVNDYYDALVYCTTNLSVGYSDIFAKTSLGKLVGSILMTFGPALSGAALDGPREEGRGETQKEILTTLQQILTHLESQKSQLDSRTSMPHSSPPA
jgi:hypothetical protein